jgi:hypothetical protein
MATLDDHRPLADSELDAVSGGLPGLNNMSATMTGEMVGNAIDQKISESGTPRYWWFGW